MELFKENQKFKKYEEENGLQHPLLSETSLTIVYYILSHRGKPQTEEKILGLFPKGTDIKHHLDLLVFYGILSLRDSYYAVNNKGYDTMLQRTTFFGYFSLAVRNRMKFIVNCPELEMVDFLLMKNTLYFNIAEMGDVSLVVLKKNTDPRDFISLWQDRIQFEYSTEIVSYPELVYRYLNPKERDNRYFDEGFVIVNNFPQFNNHTAGLKSVEYMRDNYEENVQIIPFPKNSLEGSINVSMLKRHL